MHIAERRLEQVNAVLVLKVDLPEDLQYVATNALTFLHNLVPVVKQKNMEHHRHIVHQQQRDDERVGLGVNETAVRRNVALFVLNREEDVRTGPRQPKYR